MKKDEIKKDVATGLSSAAGAVAGVVVGSVVAPGEAQAQEVQNNVASYDNSHDESVNADADRVSENVAADTTLDGNSATEHAEGMHTTEEHPSEPDATGVEVIGYDRVTTGDGHQIDVAVVNVNNQEIQLADVDLDGVADIAGYDANQNGEIEMEEMENVQGMGIEMQPLQEAAGFSPEFAQNDLPDYVDDANVDNYMA